MYFLAYILTAGVVGTHLSRLNCQWSLSHSEPLVSCVQLKMMATKARVQSQGSNVKDTVQTHF